jgi:hypothetical protein
MPIPITKKEWLKVKSLSSSSRIEKKKKGLCRHVVKDLAM